MNIPSRTLNAESSPSQPETTSVPSHLHLRNGGTSVVFDVTNELRMVHWGEQLAADCAAIEGLVVASRPQRVSGGLDRTPAFSAFATPAHGWLGTPTLEGHRRGSHFSAKLEVTSVVSDEASATVTFADDEMALSATLDVRVGNHGLVHQRVTLRNVGEAEYDLQSLLVGFTLPWDSTEILDSTGHHLRERSPQRRDFTVGTHLRESRRGRPGADATLLLAVGTAGFGFEQGVVHGIHTAWSGNHRILAERAVTGEAFLAGGELFGPGEVILAADESITSPWVIGSWGRGLNELSARFHGEWRSREQHPKRPRPVTLNTWEAVYFDHSLAKLTALADAAAEVGVERFVLDDGWFLGRRDDTAGLGDWFVDESVWPDGLHPLVDHVLSRGMEFGLWVEPEMINADSELARAHPEWIMHARRELPPTARQQQVLNLSHPDAYAFIATRLHELLDEYPIAYLKWDHNRDLVDAGSGPDAPAAQRQQTLALYRLIDELKAAHPGLEIESCASGGARVDLGILDRTDRIWPSDSLDPIERLIIQKYTGLVVTPEMMGSHLTTPQVHSSGRVVELAMSAATALLGHFGIEWDLTTTDAVTRDSIAAWVALSKRVRPILASGSLVHGDVQDTALDVRGVVAKDGASAFYVITQVHSSAAYPAGRVRLPGLDPARDYRVEVRKASVTAGQSALEWATNGVVMSGQALRVTGIRPPVQMPQQATVIELTAI